MALPSQKKGTAQSRLGARVGSKVTEFSSNSTKHVKRYIARRARRLTEKETSRFVLGWFSLVLLLCFATFGALWRLRVTSRTLDSTTGGTYIEGMIGSLNNLNPLFGGGTVDDSSARLIFNGLLRYNEEGKAEPDVAESYEVDPGLQKYTVKLRRDVRWHDGQTLTAKDVLFTINTIKNPVSRSSQFGSWKGVKVEAPSDYEVVFTLDSPLVTFPTLLTQPIIPKHLLEDVKIENLRTAHYNARPVGTGPFKFAALRSDNQQKQLELVANKDYFKSVPELDSFIIRTYSDDDALADALANREVMAAVDIKPDSVRRFADDPVIRLSSAPLSSGVFAFLKTTAPKLSDSSLRKALAGAIDRQAVLEQFHGTYRPLATPTLPTMLGNARDPRQTTNSADANALLDAAGWVKQSDGTRKKGGESLTLSLVTIDSPEYSQLANRLVQQWKAVGVTVQAQMLNPEILQQNALKSHDYDILLYGISFGHDPDTYAYWHSSQARTGGYNFSEWKSPRADVSLQFGRVTSEVPTRISRYKILQDEWIKQTPAIALYQPYTTYAHHENARGILHGTMDSTADRLANVEDWTVSLRSVRRTP